MKRLTGRIFVVLFALAMLARLVRILVPAHHGAGPHPSSPPAVHEDAFLSGEVVEHRQFSDEFVLRASNPGAHGDTRVRIDPSQTRVRLGATDVTGDVVQVGDHATVAFAAPSSEPDAPRLAKTVRLARAPSP